jgi:hypothetical protein
MLPDCLAFGGGKLLDDSLVGQQVEYRLLVGQFGAETIDNTDRAVLISADERMGEVKTKQEFLDGQFSVDQVDGEIAGEGIEGNARIADAVAVRESGARNRDANQCRIDAGERIVEMGDMTS